MEQLDTPPTTTGPAAWFTGDVGFDVLAAPPARSRLTDEEDGR